MKNKIPIIVVSVLCGIVVLTQAVSISKLKVQLGKCPIGAYSQYGMEGMYRASDISLPDEEGTALTLDVNGNLVISSTSVLTVTCQ